MLQLNRTVDPAVPFTLDELKAHLVVDADFTDDDILINRQAEAAMDRVEQFTSRSIMPQTWVMNLDRFPEHGQAIRTPRPPLQSVTSIQYIDCDGVTQTLAGSEYKVDTFSEPGRIVEAYDKCWPDTRDEIASVTITYVAGYADADSVPETIRHALLLILGSFYRDREDSAPVNLTNIPLSAKSLLYSHKTGFWW